MQSFAKELGQLLRRTNPSTSPHKSTRVMDAQTKNVPFCRQSFRTWGPLSVICIITRLSVQIERGSCVCSGEKRRTSADSIVRKNRQLLPETDNNRTSTIPFSQIIEQRLLQSLYGPVRGSVCVCALYNCRVSGICLCSFFSL